MNCVKSEIVPTIHGVRHLVYAGSPAQKDLILPYLIAIKDINNDQVRVVADIVGVTKEQVKTLLQIDDPEKIGIIEKKQAAEAVKRQICQNQKTRQPIR